MQCFFDPWGKCRHNLMVKPEVVKEKIKDEKLRARYGSLSRDYGILADFMVKMGEVSSQERNFRMQYPRRPSPLRVKGWKGSP
jgi:hypothetical protein